MGFSLTTVFALLAVVAIVVLDILAGGLLPSISDYSTSWRSLRERRINEIQSQINITGVLNGTTTSWWNRSFGFRKQFTVNEAKIAATLTNYPLLVDITDTDLQMHVQQTNGNDIAFVNGSNKLDHQIEMYESSIGHLIAWVRIPTLIMAFFNTFYIYYGNATCRNQQNPSQVWESNFHGVWHLNETPTSQIFNHVYDSTSHKNSGTAYNSPTYNAVGKIGYGMSFDGLNDYVSCGDPADGSLDFGTGSFTLECWVKIGTSAVVAVDIIGKRYTICPSASYGYALGLDHCFLDAELDEISCHDLGPGKTSLSSVTWHHLAIVFDRTTNANYYLDGRLDDFKIINNWKNTSSSSNNFLFCRYYNGVTWTYFSGTLDEVRVSQGTRTAAWILTSYYNQYSPSTFYSIDDEETIYHSLMVENIGTINLITNKFTLLINGKTYDCTCYDPTLFPLNEGQFIMIVNLTSGPKQFKMITGTGAEDDYYFEG